MTRLQAIARAAQLRQRFVEIASVAFPQSGIVDEMTRIAEECERLNAMVEQRTESRPLAG